MRKVRFYLESGYVGANQEEIVEYPDGTSDQEIQDDFEDWVDQYAGWYDLEEEGDSDVYKM